jgi:hypothetical protein
MEEQGTNKGALIGSIIIVVVLLIGGFYFWKNDGMKTSLQSGGNEAPTAPDEQTLLLNKQGGSTNLDAIEQDLGDTKLDNLDQGLDDIQKSLSP